MIEINSLTKKYGQFCAVNNISLTINAGEVFGFLGVNGAGKTTTLRMLVGTLRPTSGHIRLGGFDLLEEPLLAKSITGYIPDRPYIYPKLSGREFLEFVAGLYRVSLSRAEANIDRLLEEYSLTEWQNELVEGYSHGMKQRLATCAALVHEPRILIIDEPMVGLDPHGAKLLKESMRRYASQGMTIMLSTHSLNVAEEVSDRLAIINNGSIVTSGTLNELYEKSGAKEDGLEKLFLRITARPEGALGLT